MATLAFGARLRSITLSFMRHLFSLAAGYFVGDQTCLAA